MTNTEKIVLKTKEYILQLYSEGLSTHQGMVLGLKYGIDLFIGRKDNSETIKEEILTQCLKEFDEVTKDYYKVGHIKLSSKIRSQFIDFVSALNVNEISDIINIPFERRLNEIEDSMITIDLKDKFDFGTWKDNNYYWEPLTESQNQKPLIFFEIELFNEYEKKVLIEILIQISGDRILFLREFDYMHNYEIETSLFDIKRNGGEFAYCDINTDWIIYISHEGIVTFSGEKLTTAIEEKLPELMKLKNTYLREMY